MNFTVKYRRAAIMSALRYAFNEPPVTVPSGERHLECTGGLGEPAMQNRFTGPVTTRAGRSSLPPPHPRETHRFAGVRCARK